METTLGVKIDPRGAQSGADAIEKAVEDIRRSARGLRGDFLETFSGKAVLAGGIVTELGVVGKALLDTSPRRRAVHGRDQEFIAAPSLATREASTLAYAASLNGTSAGARPRHGHAQPEHDRDHHRDRRRRAPVRRAGGVCDRYGGHLRGTADVFLDVVNTPGLQ